MADRKYRTETKDWRILFDSKALQTAQNHIKKGNYRGFFWDGNMAAATVGSGFHPRITRCPKRYSEDWDEEWFHCSCAAANPRRNRWGDYGVYKKTCSHEACLLMLWEMARGPWKFTETEEEWKARKEEEEYQKRLKKYEKEKERDSKIIRPLSDWHFKEYPLDDQPFFDIPSIVKDRETSLFAINSASGHLDKNEISQAGRAETGFQRNGSRNLTFKFHTINEFEKASTEITIDSRDIVHKKCSCQQRDYAGYWGWSRNEDDSPALCGHELAALHLMWDYICEKNPGDATDQKAERLFSILDGGGALDYEESPEREIPKRKCITIKPHLSVKPGGLSLNFKINKDGGKPLVLKAFRQFQEAVENETVFQPGKNLCIDFSKETTDDDSEIWMEYIRGKINDADRVNTRLASRSSYYGYGVSVRSSETLTGAALDQFYRLTEGTDIEYEDKENRKKGLLHIGGADAKIKLTGLPVKNASGILNGIQVSGSVATIISGQRDRYILTQKALGLLTESKWVAISPFQSIADKYGNISFTVGKQRLGEFYYRIVPGLLDNPCFDFDDQTGGDISPLLPPEPVFVFKFDLSPEEGALLQCQVSYDDNTYTLNEETVESTAASYRDEEQEKRVRKCIGTYFDSFDPERGTWTGSKGDDALFRLMSEGIPAFSGFGEILSTDAFMGRSVRRMPYTRVNVSVDSGLLNISLLSNDLSGEELAQIYNSYQRRKHYHKLKSGEYLALDDTGLFESIESLSRGMDLSAEELIKDTQQIPLYRALYLDHLLEEHDELAGNRDKTYRTLIKGFRTIRDADYDVPASMENVLRPYQTYGHKWMRTVCEAGFGGILADEMGLGKTVEAISIMAAMKEEGKLNSPALIVCPASLIYNWEDEIHRFAPGLEAVPVTGIPSVRKKLLGLTGKADPGSPSPDVYITSYDLLRSDVTSYRKKNYSLMIIDEAQYIKNSKAAMTKAVKSIAAEKRMALTGTPIENRLAELWSIFDYLMPGFLYDYKNFKDKFEVPVSKKKDAEATAKLRQMVEPFILRRLKKDVLKDLPPKLEEVRYARLEDRQRELYDAQVLKMKGMLQDGSGKGEEKIKILAELMHIRQICCDPSLLFEDYKGDSAKRFACMELIKNAMSADHRMLVFSQFTSMLALLEEDLKEEKIAYYKITGSTPKEQRIRYVHDFNEGDVPVFLVSLKAGGTGLNLTGADVVIHYDPWWNLAVQNQATDRAHRIGQSKTVTVYKLIARDTIEERILELQQSKKDLADAILSGENKSLMSLSEEELLALLD